MTPIPVRDAARNYRQTLRQRQEREAQTVVQLTGWDLQEINRKINFTPETSVLWRRRLCP
ncbi:MAG: hypothetical protein HC890_01205 [Chloroflexaceae bacterium]|nr:hypothetical protein [Chloroflexaceae bacterium]